MWLTIKCGAILVAAISLELSSANWRSVNDGVMGGISTGSMKQEDGALVFSGELSLENNGGFASVRSLVETDLTGCDRVRLSVRGDGRTYQFRIRQDENFDGIAWRSILPATADWKVLELPFSDFVPVFRGRKVAGAGPVYASRIRQVGFMLADNKPGSFRLEVRTIDFLPASCDRKS